MNMIVSLLAIRQLTNLFVQPLMTDVTSGRVVSRCIPV